MSVLAFKAIGYGAEQIPDKFFEKIPGGYFKSGEKKKKGKTSRSPPEGNNRRNGERPRRERNPQNDYSDSGDDTDYEEERRRRKSSGRSTSRSLSRGRDKQRSRDVGEERSDRDMAYPEQGQGQGPYFPPPPTSEYRPYDPQEHASRRSQDDYRPTSAQPQYGYPTQPANAQTFPTQPPTVAYGDEAAHRYEEIQHAKAGNAQHPRSGSAARYTPGPGYAPSPVVMPTAPIPPPPVGTNSPQVGTSAPYAPYNPATYAANNPAYPPENGYASPPSFYRQQSRSQPDFDPNQPYSSYNPRSSDQQVAQYDDRQSPSRRSSTKHDRREHRRRARFDDMDLRTKNLGATVAGALAGGFAGRAAGQKMNMGDSHRARAHALDTGSMKIATAAVTGRAAEASELEAKVLLTASAQSLEAETIATTVATAADAMIATGTMTVTVTTTVMTAADVVTGAEIVDAQIMDTRSMKNMTISLNPIQTATDRLLCSVGKRLQREGTIELWFL
ncbi:hypothetical protein EKO04_003613 [Ascochyta lentis]|uniref:Uncharacterized protein n=1 Tax=Ascochyta lentis TaxID=205686 RepID=A0A8H7J9X2_9PLEO|nr:hypothetical protein EKO04_003613 [Ascochyta lentis]